MEGELRSWEYASKKTETEQRIWEIRAGMILKLDRAEKSLPEEQAQEEEGEAAEASSIPSLKPANGWASIDLETCYELRVDSSISPVH